MSRVIGVCTFGHITHCAYHITQTITLYIAHHSSRHISLQIAHAMSYHITRQTSHQIILGQGPCPRRPKLLRSTSATSLFMKVSQTCRIKMVWTRHASSHTNAICEEQCFAIILAILYNTTIACGILYCVWLLWAASKELLLHSYHGKLGVSSQMCDMFSAFGAWCWTTKA